MSLTLILSLIFILIVVLVIIVIFSTTCNRNYWRRVLPVQKCTFGRRKYEVVEKINERNKEGNEVKGIVAYSLYGNYDKYSVKVIQNCLVVPKKLKGWHVRVYTAKDVPKPIIQKITGNDGEVFIMGPELPLGHEGALWRFHAVKENCPVVCLDADDEFNSSIENQIKKWLSSKYQFASFSKHAYFVPLAAGLWGYRPDKKHHLQNIDQEINSYCEHWFGFDECFLKYHLWPKFKEHGYYQSSGFFFKELTIIGIVLFLILIIWTLRKVYHLEKQQKRDG